MTFPWRVPKDRLSVTTHRTISLSAGVAPRVPAILCAAALLLLVALPPAFAQGRLDAHYEATLSGIPVGRGAWTIDISDDQFSASASGGTAGLLKAFSGGSGTGAAQGRAEIVHCVVTPDVGQRRIGQTGVVGGPQMVMGIDDHGVGTSAGSSPSARRSRQS